MAGLSYSRINTATTTEQSQGVPLEPKLESITRLRFTDENGQPYPEWEEKKLGELFSIRSGRNKPHYSTGDFLDLTMGSVSSEGKMILKGRTNDKKDLLHKGEIITPTRGQQKVGWKIIGRTLVIEEDDKYTAGNCTFVLSKTTGGVDSKYASLAINNSRTTREQIVMSVTGTSQMMINKDPYMSVSIPLPSLPEQEKIGAFLSALDDEVEQAERLVSLLSDRKKAYAQRIFDRTLRFHDDNGNPYPEWEEKKLGEVLFESREKGTNGEIAKKMTVKLWGKGVFAKNSKGSANTVFFKRSSGQLIYSKLDFLNGAFGIIPSHLNGYETTADMPTFDIDQSKMDRRFLINLVCRKEFYSDFAKDTGSNRKAKRINQAHFLNKQVHLPSLPEQEKIGSFLSALDDEIDEAKRELELLKEQKKAYAQRIFGV